MVTRNLERGIRIGINMQLFGNSNLQLAFTLSDRDEEDLSAAISERLPLITKDLPFDVYDLSFGEFFGSEPQKFIDSTNQVGRSGPSSSVTSRSRSGSSVRIGRLHR